MALSITALALFAKEVVPRLRGGTAVALGVPEIGASPHELTSILGRPVRVATYAGIMESLGFDSWSTIDVSSYEGCDYVADLNVPLRGIPQFDLVIDNGTIEHCFNVAQAFFNAKALCKTGGIIFHNNPANWFGHGFWNMSPCAYFDFYEANGFSVDVFLRDVATQSWEPLEYRPKLTRVLPARRFVVHAIATRMEAVPDYIPTQRWCLTQHAEARGPNAAAPSALEGRRPYLAAHRWSERLHEFELRLRALKTAPAATPARSWQRKLRKLRRNPLAFVVDSRFFR